MLLSEVKRITAGDGIRVYYHRPQNQKSSGHSIKAPHQNRENSSHNHRRGNFADISFGCTRGSFWNTTCFGDKQWRVLCTRSQEEPPQLCNQVKTPWISIRATAVTIKDPPFEHLSHPPNSPDLVLSYFNFFEHFKEVLRASISSMITE